MGLKDKAKTAIEVTKIIKQDSKKDRAGSGSTVKKTSTKK